MAKDVGRFCWHELMTTDPKGAMAFYSEVIGWKTQPFGNDYTMWVGSQGPLGGVMILPEEAKKMGAPSHWMAHVLVDDVDATVAKAKKLGAKIYVEPQDIPTVGRFSVIADPQGAIISAFKPLEAMTAHDPGKHGEFCWNELIANDSAAALGFYGELFGWQKKADHDMGPMGVYRLFGSADKDYGGMFSKTKDMPMPPSWLYYVNVDDLDAAVKRATSNGGKLLNGPMDVPGGGRIAQMMDPQGAAFALHHFAGK